MNRAVGIAIAFVIGLFLTQSVVYADTDNQTNKGRHGRIVGLWEINVVVANCTTGATVASFRAMHKYERGGTGQVVPATNPASLSEHSMVWSHVQGNDYQMAFKTFRFDSAGNSIGWIVARNDVSLSDDGYVYSGSGVAEIFNSAGVLVGASCPSFSGTRFM